jgi:hypothetical protein
MAAVAAKNKQLASSSSSSTNQPTPLNAKQRKARRSKKQIKTTSTTQHEHVDTKFSSIHKDAKLNNGHPTFHVGTDDDKFIRRLRDFIDDVRSISFKLSW